jgi:hypothetical protein
VDNAHEDLPAIWSLWVPAQLVNFGFSPLWLRVPFVAVVSAIWTAFVSVKRGGAVAEGASGAAEAAAKSVEAVAASAQASAVASASSAASAALPSRITALTVHEAPKE